MMRDRGWADLLAWEVDDGSGAPLYRQVYGQLRSAILAGTLRPGDKLPSTRELAAELGLSRSSIVSAYEQLLAEGYVSGKIGSGTYVSSDIPQPIERPKRARESSASRRRFPAQAQAFGDFAASTSQTDTRPFNTGRTLLDARTVEIWRKLSLRALRSIGPDHLGYSDPQGFIELRRAICDYLASARAVACGPEQVIVTAGAQNSIDIASRVLLNPGDEVWVEDPGYPMSQYALAAAGAKLRPIPVDRQGIDVGAGLRLAPKAAAAFVTPSHQYPTGVVLSMARRLELLAWARESAAWIVEDDYASEFRYGGRPLAALQGLDDGERVIYVGTLNKALFPGLRMGYIIVPRPLLSAFTGLRYIMDRQPPSLFQTVVADFMRDGHLAAHIRRMRLLYRSQRDSLAAQLTRRAGAELTVDLPDQGMHLVAYLRDGLSDVAIETAARERGIVARALSRLYSAAPPRSGLMLGFSGFPQQTIIPAAARLAEIVKAASRAAPLSPCSRRRAG